MPIPSFTRALIAFLLLPGLVAFAIPIAWLCYTVERAVEHPSGLVSLGVGFVGLTWCARDFYVSGKGTLAPWSPPQRLVVVGLYRYSRNPMYLSVLLILIGWSVSFASYGLFSYTFIVAVAFHLRVVYGEEPWLSRKHGADWVNYANRVPRWLW